MKQSGVEISGSAYSPQGIRALKMLFTVLQVVCEKVADSKVILETQPSGEDLDLAAVARFKLRFLVDD